MKVLLTGATGFLGRHVIEKLTAEGCDIVTIVRPTSQTAHLKTYKNIHYVQGNIRDEESLEKAMKGVDAVVHAVTTKFGNGDDFYAENVVSTDRLLQLSQKNKVKRFVFISSIDVYDHAGLKDKAVLTEEAPRDPHPSNHYGRTKILAEELVEKAHREAGVPTVIIRPACIYGPGGNWYPARLGFSAGAGRYAVLGNGRSDVPMSHTSSVADLIWRCIDQEAAIGQTYNVVEDGKITRIDFLKRVKAVLYPDFKIIKMPMIWANLLAFAMRTALKVIGKPAPTRIHPLYMRLFSTSVFYNSDKAKRELGWQPLQDLGETIDAMLRWHRERLDAPRSQMLIPELPVKIHSDKVLDVGIVGCGAFASLHMTVMNRLPQGCVVAVCDPNLEAAQAVAAKYKVPHAYASLDEMLDKHKLDVVHIVSPAHTHKALAIQAMKKGCHVLVEKPMAMDAKEAREMQQAADDLGVRLCVEHTLLYNDAMIQARKAIQNGAIGKIVQIESWFGTAYSSNPGAPFLRYDAKDMWVFKMPGQLFQDLMPHPLSVLLDVMGDVDEITVKSRYNQVVPHMKVDELRILLENESVMATLSLSFGATPRHNFLTVYGTQGTVRVDFMTGTALIYKDMGMLPKVMSRNMVAVKHGKTMIKTGRKNIRTVFNGKHVLLDGHENLFRLFYRSLLEGTPMPVSRDNAIQSMEVMDRIWAQVRF